MELQQVMVDAIRYLAAYTATEDSCDIAKARQIINEYAQEYGVGSKELLALWDVTISLQRYISRVGAEA